jgi:Mg-chelatase subunit ChlD
MTKKSAWICLSILFLFSLIPVQNINAQEETPENISVILIVDNSGSMEANDPDKLRFTAAQLFTALLDIGDSLGVLTFSTTSQWVTDGMITLESNQEKIDLIAQIQATEPDGYTDVQAAFRDVEKLFQKSAYKEKNPVVIFLTDGKPEIEQPYMTYEAETLALIEQIGVPVLSIALTSEAQTTFLKKLTGATDGMVIPAQTASDLLDAYLEVFGQVKDRTVIEPESITASGKIVLNVNPSLAPYIDKIAMAQN